jgi:hypothetical protein
MCRDSGRRRPEYAARDRDRNRQPSSTGCVSLTPAGTASDNVGVTQVTWSNNRRSNGAATGTTALDDGHDHPPAGNLTVTARTPLETRPTTRPARHQPRVRRVVLAKWIARIGCAPAATVESVSRVTVHANAASPRAPGAVKWPLGARRDESP